MAETLRKLFRVARTAVLVTVVVVAGGSAAWVAERQSAAQASPAAPGTEKEKVEKADKVARVGADRVTVPRAMATRMGLQTGVAERPSRPIPLPPFQGNLACDTNAMQRVHSRFAGEVMELGTVAEPSGLGRESAPIRRPLRVGDPVAAGQLLAVVWSKDLGEKKSELVDAASRLKLDTGVVRRLRDLYKSGGTAERAVLEAERAVESDRVAVERAERTLRSWRLSEAEVAAIRSEAETLSDRPEAHGDAADWARVEVRAGRGGVVLEKNLTSVGDIVDTATTLFVVGDMSQLTVWAHVYEDDLPLLNELPKPIRWVVSLPSQPKSAFPGTLEQVGAVIDPNQHTALVSGRVPNPKGELKIGQIVTVSVELPAPARELVVPADAVVEDGRESLVFVQPDASASEYVRRPVRVLRRTRTAIYLQDLGTGLRAGDRVVTAGSLLLRDAMDALPAPAASGD